MDSRRIGTLNASVVGLGCNQLGTDVCQEALSTRIVHEALDAGINFFDTADEYGGSYRNPNDSTGWGRSEEVIGRALRNHRDTALIATKFGAPRPGHAGQGGASARWARLAVESSLRRLGTDRIDLYQLHVPDSEVPIAETLGVLDEMVCEGKIREIGCANFASAAIQDADAAARRLGTSRFVSCQGPLNLLQRTALDELMPTCEQLDICFIPYYPLASGVLTGKYRREQAAPKGTRLREQVSEAGRERILSSRTFDRLEALEIYAADRGHTLLELAFAWLLSHRSVATVIAGAARAGQVSTNASAATWKMSSAEVAEVMSLASA